MQYMLGDIFIGNFPRTQEYGDNPAMYNARYGIKAHNGADFATPSMTLVLSAADGWVSEAGFDQAGYGNYLKIVHDGYLTLYAHLNSFAVSKGDRVIAGQLIGHSDNTGNSTGPHLHFAVAPCDQNGIKTEMSNGYSGYIDPMGERCNWQIKNLTAPLTQNVENPDMPVKASDFMTMNVQGTNYKEIANFCQANRLNDFLGANGQGEVNFLNNPNDPDGGKKINMFIADLIYQIRELREKSHTPTPPPVDVTPTEPVVIPTTIEVTADATVPMTEKQKVNIFLGIMSQVKGFFWK